MKENKTKESGIKKLPLYIACAGLVVAIVLTGINTFTRYFFSYTYAGTSEIISIGFIWTVFGGAAYAYRLGQHYGIDLLVKALPKAVQTVVELIARFALVVIFAICTYLAAKYTVDVHDSPMPATHITYSVYFSASVYGFGMMLVYAAMDLIRDARSAFNRKGGAN